jgi:nitrogen regulatory protein PII
MKKLVATFPPYKLGDVWRAIYRAPMDAGWIATVSQRLARPGTGVVVDDGAVGHVFEGDASFEIELLVPDEDAAAIGTAMAKAAFTRRTAGGTVTVVPVVELRTVREGTGTTATVSHGDPIDTRER